MLANLHLAYSKKNESAVEDESCEECVCLCVCVQVKLVMDAKDVQSLKPSDVPLISYGLSCDSIMYVHVPSLIWNLFMIEAYILINGTAL